MTFLNGLFAEVEDVGLASGFGVVAAGAAGDFRCGSRPAGELLLQTPSMGFALWARLRRSKLAPGEFVFACPKTNLSGTNLDARSAPEGFAPGQAQIQSNQKKRRPSGMLFLRFSLWRWGDRRSFPASSVAARLPDAPLRAFQRQSLRCSGMPHGTKIAISRMTHLSIAVLDRKSPKGCAKDCARVPRDMEVPSGRPAARTRSAGKVRHPGGVFFGYFLLAEQKKVTRVRGGSPHQKMIFRVLL
jgi:hypothetical protein